MNKLLLPLLILLVSCGYSSQDDGGSEMITAQDKNSAERSVESAPMMKSELQSSSDNSIESQPNNRKMIIKNGSLEFEVKDVAAHKRKVDVILKKFKGYYSNETLNKNDYRYDFTLTARIPSDSFDSFTDELIKAGGTLTRQDVNSNDVTGEYRDLDLRLSNKMAYLERYRAILKQANKISDILEVEEKIRVIEEEVESVKGRMKYLNDQVGFSTLNINLFQLNETPMKPNDGFFSRLWQSIVGGWSGLTEFILIFVMLWPFVIIAALVFYVILKWRRRTKKTSKVA